VTIVLAVCVRLCVSSVVGAQRASVQRYVQWHCARVCFRVVHGLGDSGVGAMQDMVSHRGGTCWAGRGDVCDCV
jgi:hypothetical protein